MALSEFELKRLEKLVGQYTGASPDAFLLFED
jgi:hypothetical protein